MRGNRITLGFIGLILLLTISGWWIASNTHSQQNVQPNKQSVGRIPDKFRYPVVEFTSPPSVVAERMKISNRYDIGWSFVFHSPSPNVTGRGHEPETTPPDAIPVGSNLVVIGQVLSATAYLTNDKRNVYSEFLIRIDKILKGDPTFKNFVPAETVTADRRGGRVRYANGQEVTYEVVGYDMPRVGKTHLFFLTRDQQSPNYRILTGYELHEDIVEPLDLAVGFSDLPQDKSAFIKKVRERILGGRNDVKSNDPK